MEVNVNLNCLHTNSLQNIFPLCSTEERKSFRFGTTWWWGNDEKIFFL